MITKDNLSTELPSKHNLLKAGFQLVIAGFFFSLLAVFIKMSSEGSLNLISIIFFRNFFALLCFIPIIVYTRTSIKTKEIKFHLLRTTLGLSGMYCYFYAIAHIPLGQASVLKFSGPIFVPILGYFFLKEKLSKNILLSVIIGFVGVVLVIGPQLDNIQFFASLMGLASSLAGAAVVVLLRRMSVSEPSLRTAFYFAFLSTIVCCISYFLSFQNLPSNKELIYLALAGAAACIGQIYMTKAYANARAGSLAPYTYIAVIFAAIWGFAVWNEVPPLLSFLGGGIILVGILTVNKDAKKGVSVHRLGG